MNSGRSYESFKTKYIFKKLLVLFIKILLIINKIGTKLEFWAQFTTYKVT